MELALSVEQMKHLKELGVDLSKASMWWCRIVRPACPPTKKEKVMVDWFLSTHKEQMHTGLDIVETMPAFILNDILNLLPKYIYDEQSGYYANLCIDYEREKILYGRTDGYGIEVWYGEYMSDDLTETAYRMLCWAAENNYLNTNSNYE